MHSRQDAAALGRNDDRLIGSRSLVVESSAKLRGAFHLTNAYVWRVSRRPAAVAQDVDLDVRKGREVVGQSRDHSPALARERGQFATGPGAMVTLVVSIQRRVVRLVHGRHFRVSLDMATSEPVADAPAGYVQQPATGRELEDEDAHCANGKLSMGRRQNLRV